MNFFKHIKILQKAGNSDEEKVLVFDNYYLHLIVFSLLNTFLYVIALGAVMDLAPSRLSWIQDYSLALCLVAGIIAAIISTRNTKELSMPGKIINSSITSIIGLAIILALYFISLVLKPEQYVTISSFDKKLESVGFNANQMSIFEKKLQEIGLNANQMHIIDNYINDKGYVTSAEINYLGLNEVQRSELIATLKNYHYVTDEQVVNIIATQDTIKATEAAISTAEAKVSTCFIETEVGFPTVAIRDKPSINSGHSISYLVNGVRLLAVGHNGGKININRWWLVQFGQDDDLKYGWVSSYYVNEINEIACLKLPIAPGSSLMDK